MNDVLGAPIMTRCSGYREPKPSKRRTAYEDIFAPFPASASREKAGRAPRESSVPGWMTWTVSQLFSPWCRLWISTSRIMPYCIPIFLRNPGIVLVWRAAARQPARGIPGNLRLPSIPTAQSG